MLVQLFTQRDSDDAEYEQVVQAWRRLYRDGGKRPVFGFVVVASGHAAPNARWRRRIAEAQRESQGPKRVAIVTTNPLIRAVITAVDWIAPPGPGQYTTAFATFDGAVRAFELHEGRPLDRLRSLYAEAQTAAARMDGRADRLQHHS